MTVDINEFYGITITHGERVALGEYRAFAQAFRRDTMRDVGERFDGFGRMMSSADTAALRVATTFVNSLRRPKGWKASK